MDIKTKNAILIKIVIGKYKLTYWNLKYYINIEVIVRVILVFFLVTTFCFAQSKIISTVSIQSDLRTKPSVLGKTIMKINPGEKIEFLDFEEEFYYVKYKDTCGFLIESWIKDIDTVKYYLKIKKGIDPFIPELTYKQKEIERYIKRNPHIRESFKDALRAEMIELGMTREMVRYAWGRPDDININVGSWGISEQWVYSKNNEYRFAYFDNGILDSYQE